MKAFRGRGRPRHTGNVVWRPAPLPQDDKSKSGIALKCVLFGAQKSRSLDCARDDNTLVESKLWRTGVSAPHNHPALCQGMAFGHPVIGWERHRSAEALRPPKNRATCFTRSDWKADSSPLKRFGMTIFYAALSQFLCSVIAALKGCPFCRSPERSRKGCRTDTRHSKSFESE